MELFKSTESEVRVYSRAFPVIFNRAKNAHLYTEDGKEYLDFLAGDGSLNYGHNNDEVIKCLMPLTTSEDDLRKGAKLLAQSVDEIMQEGMSKAS